MQVTAQHTRKKPHVRLHVRYAQGLELWAAVVTFPRKLESGVSYFKTAGLPSRSSYGALINVRWNV